MNYDREIFEQAEQVLNYRRNQAEAEQMKRYAEIAVIAPEVEELERKLHNTGFELMNLVMNKDENMASRIKEIQENNLRTQHTIEEILEVVKGDRHYLDVNYSCNKCQDTGYIEGRRCSCFEELLKKLATEKLNENCLIELHDFMDFRLDYYDRTPENGISPYEKMSQTLEYCQNYVKDFSENSPSLFFCGETGLGKTFLSSCIAKALLEKGVKVVFGSIIDFLRRIENEHFGREQGNTIDTLIDADLVILDDLGSEFRTSFTESAIYDIINSRINLGKPTIISTNLTTDELNEDYNERIVSRLTGCFHPIKFLGKDIRHIMRMKY